MFEFFISVLLAYGITNIIVRGSIFDGIKEILENYMIATRYRFIKWYLNKILTLVNCPMCSGFWVGVGVGSFYGPFEPWNILCNGALYSGTCWLLHCITEFLGQGSEAERSITVYHVQADVEDHEETEEYKPDTDKSRDKRKVLYG